MTTRTFAMAASTAWYCFHCYATNPRASGPCAKCDDEIEPPPELSYDERLIWALDHPLADTAITAARLLGARRTAAAAGPLRRVVAAQRDPYLAAHALRALVAVEGFRATRPLLRELAAQGPMLLRRVARAELVGGRSPLS
jgi:hypothetical protein